MARSANPTIPIPDAGDRPRIILHHRGGDGIARFAGGAREIEAARTARGAVPNWNKGFWILALIRGLY